MQYNNNNNNRYPQFELQNFQNEPESWNNDSQDQFDQAQAHNQQSPVVIQQGVVYSSVPPNAQILAHPYYNNSLAANGVPNPQSFDQIPLAAPQNEVTAIETKIKTGFSVYTFILYSGLVLSVIGIIVSLLPGDRRHHGLIEAGLGLIPMLAFIIALRAKSKLNTKVQLLALVIFAVITILHIVATGFAIYRTTQFPEYQHHQQGQQQQQQQQQQGNGQDHQQQQQHHRRFQPENSPIVILLLSDVVFGLVTYYARVLFKLMKERQNVINGNRAGVSQV